MLVEAIAPEQVSPAALEAEQAFWRAFALDPIAGALRHATAQPPLSDRRRAYVVAVQDAVLFDPRYLPYTTKTGRGRSFCNIAFSDQARRLGVRGASMLGIRSANAQTSRLKDRAARRSGWIPLTDKPFMQELANLGIFVGAGRTESIPDACGELHGHVAMARCGPAEWVHDPAAPYINNVGTRNWVVPHERAHRDFAWFTPVYDPTARVIAAEAVVQYDPRFRGERSPAATWLAALLQAAVGASQTREAAPTDDRSCLARCYAAGLRRDLARSGRRLPPNEVITACRALSPDR